MKIKYGKREMIEVTELKDSEIGYKSAGSKLGVRIVAVKVLLLGLQYCRRL